MNPPFSFVKNNEHYRRIGDFGFSIADFASQDQGNKQEEPTSPTQAKSGLEWATECHVLEA
jgi:hypothetical protein